MLFAICCVSASPMRAAASHKSEMVSQLLFGEYCRVTQSGDEQWLRIACRQDGYEGWCQRSHLLAISEDQYLGPGNILTMERSGLLETSEGPMMLPMGSLLAGPALDLKDWPGTPSRFGGRIWDSLQAEMTPQHLREVAFQFLNTPYLWGGRSVFGTDCSGFTQTVFRFFNISLLRDAWQQVSQGFEPDSSGKVCCGDLAFFDNESGRITHVGIMLGEDEIIHASGKVRIDPMDPEGIIHSESGQRTHRLRSIRRFFP